MSTKKPTKKVAPSEKKEALTKKPMLALFNAIQYENDESLESFFSKMDTNQAVFVLIAASNLAQAKGGVYNVLEAEAVSVAIRTIKKAATAGSKKETTKSNSAK